MNMGSHLRTDVRPYPPRRTAAFGSALIVVALARSTRERSGA
jgi:hypothetical protein